MTDKEIEIQRALGTLPFWKRLELGDVKITVEEEEIIPIKPVTITHLIHVKISCEGIQSSYWMFPETILHKDHPKSMAEAIQSLANKGEDK